MKLRFWVLLCLVILGILGVWKGPELWRQFNQTCGAFDKLTGQSGCIAVIPLDDIIMPIASRPAFLDEGTIGVVSFEERGNDFYPVFLEMSVSDQSIIKVTPIDVRTNNHMIATISPTGEYVILTTDFGSPNGLHLFDWAGKYLGLLQGTDNDLYRLRGVPIRFPDVALKFKNNTVAPHPRFLTEGGSAPIWSLSDGRLLQGQEGDLADIDIWPDPATQKGDAPPEKTMVIWADQTVAFAIKRRVPPNRAGEFENALYRIDLDTDTYSLVRNLTGLDNSYTTPIAFTSDRQYMAFSTEPVRPNAYGLSVVRTDDQTHTWSVDFDGLAGRSIALLDDGSRVAVSRRLGPRGNRRFEFLVFETDFN